MFCSNCGKEIQPGTSFCPRCHTSLSLESNNTTNSVNLIAIKRSRSLAIASFLLSIIPIAVVLFSLMCSNNSAFSSEVKIMLSYFLTIGLPIAAISLVTGIMSLMTNKNSLAVIGIILSVLPLVFIVVYIL